MEPKLEAKVENLAMIRIPTHVYEDHLIGRCLCSSRGPNCDLGSWFPTLSFLFSLFLVVWFVFGVSVDYRRRTPCLFHTLVCTITKEVIFLLSTMY